MSITTQRLPFAPRQDGPDLFIDLHPGPNGRTGQVIVAELLDFPGCVQVFEWLPAHDLPSPSETTARALAALAALAGVVHPLTAELAAACGAPGSDPLPKRFFHLRQAELPYGVLDAPTYAPVERRSRPRLTPTALKDWTEDALARLTCGPGEQPQWVTLSMDSTRARLFGPASAAARLDTGEGEPLAIPLVHEDGAVWLAGPLAAQPLRPPVALEVLHIAGALWLTVSVHWSPWGGASPGAACLGRALEGLLAQGWREATDDGGRPLRVRGARS